MTTKTDIGDWICVSKELGLDYLVVMLDLSTAEYFPVFMHKGASMKELLDLAKTYSSNILCQIIDLHKFTV